VELANAMLYSSFTGKAVDVPMDSAAYEHRLMELIRASAVEKANKDTIAPDVATSFNITPKK